MLKEGLSPIMGVFRAGFGRNGGFERSLSDSINLKVSMCGGASRINDPIPNSLLTKMGYFFTKMKILD